MTEEVDVVCACGTRFRVAASLKGGLANCPGCGKATSVPRGIEVLFWMILTTGVVLDLAVTVAIWATSGPAAGAIAFAIGAAILTAFVVAS